MTLSVMVDHDVGVKRRIEAFICAVEQTKKPFSRQMDSLSGKLSRFLCRGSTLYNKRRYLKCIHHCKQRQRNRCMKHKYWSHYCRNTMKAALLQHSLETAISSFHSPSFVSHCLLLLHQLPSGKTELEMKESYPKRAPEE